MTTGSSGVWRDVRRPYALGAATAWGTDRTPKSGGHHWRAFNWIALQGASGPGEPGRGKCSRVVSGRATATYDGKGVHAGGSNGGTLTS